MRRAGFFGDHPLRDKEHQLASRKCRRESTPQTPVNAASIRAVGAVDPVAPRNITKKKSATSSAAAAPPRRPEQGEMRRAGFFGDHPLRDKEHQLASRKCRRESTPQTPVNAASIRAVGAVDPVAPRNITNKKQS